MPERIMFAQIKTGSGTDQGPSWVCRVQFSKTWQTARFHGLTLRRHQGVAGNFIDVETGEEWWLSGPKRDQTDARYSSQQPNVDSDVWAEYEGFLSGGSLAGRDNGYKSAARAEADHGWVSD